MKKQTDKSNTIIQKSLMDKIWRYLFLVVALICSSVIIFIVLFILIKGLTPFIKNYNIDGVFYKVDFIKFIFGIRWFKNPNIYGIGFIIVNTIYVTILSLLIAIPISILTALFIAKIAPKKISSILSYIIELLSSIPSVIYGMFGMGIVTKIVKEFSNFFGYQSAGGLSVLTVAIVLAIMIIPTITMISVSSIKAVKKTYIEGSLALGASTTQTNFKIVLSSAKNGIFSGIILGIGRALGEATAVSMVAGNPSSGPNFHPFEATKTLTSTMLQGLTEAEGLEYDIRFSVGIVLIILILGSNLLLNLVKRRINI